MPDREPILTGRFSLYETPHGGIHLAFHLEGEADDRHMEFPPAMVRMAAMAGGGRGNPLDIIKGMKASA